MDDAQFAPHSKKLDCPIHGSGLETFVCEHLVSNPVQEWFSEEQDGDDRRWPDAWCVACDVFFQEEGEWNTNNEKGKGQDTFSPPLLREIAPASKNTRGRLTS